uniref:ORF-29 protein n=1 Tax=Lymantria dispar multicapsid nuclear polyhedrosis virus TaxID=10449 RepID=V9TGF3_NPVLD|nr:ORF-29 protein [Lymantria dispar multiple nucleopolyhedrovirus]
MTFSLSSIKFTVNVASCNVNKKRIDSDRLMRDLKKSGVDIMCLQNVPPRCKSLFAATVERHGYVHFTNSHLSVLFRKQCGFVIKRAAVHNRLISIELEMGCVRILLMNMVAPRKKLHWKLLEQKMHALDGRPGLEAWRRPRILTPIILTGDLGGPFGSRPVYTCNVHGGCGHGTPNHFVRELVLKCIYYRLQMVNTHVKGLQRPRDHHLFATCRIHHHALKYFTILGGRHKMLYLKADLSPTIFNKLTGSDLSPTIFNKLTDYCCC